MPGRTIVIVGGALSGPTAAARAREIDETARIVLLERSKAVSYAVCGLAYHVSREVQSLDELDRERAAFFRDVYRVEVRTGVEVTRIDAPERTVRIKKGSPLRYDALVFALGAESVVPEIDGFAGATNVFRFRTLSDLRGVLGRLKGTRTRVAILGGGFLGVEAADALIRRGCRVTLLEKASRLLPRFSGAFAGMAARALEQAGATVVAGANVERAQRRGKSVVKLGLGSGETIAVDLVIVATGLRPRSELLRQAGARLLGDGTVVVDERCATSLPDVYACGVCVSLPHAVSGRPTWFAQAAQADKTAQVAGANAAGGDARMGHVLGTAIVRAGALALARTGLTGAEAADFAAGDLETITVHAPSHDPYFPGSQRVSLRLFNHRSSGRVLGAEAAGSDGVDKRIDVLAAAILGGLKVDQLSTLDLAYAPPYSAARDPVNVAGSVAQAARSGLAAALSPADLAARRHRVVIVDVRDAQPARSGTIEGAMGVPLAKLRGRIDKLVKGRELVFVDDNGRAGYLAARIARGHGATAAYLSGGLLAWAAEGRPLVRTRGRR
jgi:NADPH-dependent 2,4-dienoyl-CoA reductase/sulfur reductase-like enzyme/rhodanese-related sulfurtransferase